MKAAIYSRYSITTIAFVALLSFPLLSTAADKAGSFSSNIPKTDRSCGTYISARDEGRKGNYIRENKYGSWVSGYITAYNNSTQDTYNIMGNSDMDSLMSWLENYCKQNPLDSFAEATMRLMAELHPKRIRQKPKGD